MFFLPHDPYLALILPKFHMITLFVFILPYFHLGHNSTESVDSIMQESHELDGTTLHVDRATPKVLILFQNRG